MREPRSVAGLDLDLATLRHAAIAYPGVPVAAANLVALPVADGAVDLVVSSQVVEHLWDQDAFVAECARVLRPGGRLVVTTPEPADVPARATSSTPASWTPTELRALVGRHLEVRAVLGLRPGPRLAADQAENGDLVAAQMAAAGDPDDALAGAGGQPSPPADFVVDDHDLPGCLDLVLHRRTPVSEPVGTLCIVLHTHLPWLPRHGSWPVGEEWLHQAWSGSYLPLLGGARPAGRRGTAGPADPRRHPGAGGGAGRPVRAARAARLAGPLAAAGRGAGP